MSDIPEIIAPANVQNYPRKYIDEIYRLRQEVARLTAAAERLLKMHTLPDGSIVSDTSIVEGALMDLSAVLRGQPAPARE